MQHSCSHHNAFCSMTWLTRMYLRTWQHQMTTIMQPFQCDLQPRIQETNRTTHTGTATRCRTQRRNRLTSKRSKPQPLHTGGTFHRRLQPLYTEKHTVSCSGFLPNTSPNSCSHYNAFCRITYTSMQPLHCDLHPFVPEHREEPIDLETIQTATAAHRRYLSSPTAATLHGKTQGFVLRLPPQHKPHAKFNIHEAITMYFAAWRG